MIYPSRDVIIKHNRRVIEETQGLFSPPENLLHPGSIEWVLDAIQYPLYGVYLYPTIAEKAAIIAWTIINDHVFYDGNKRTGLFVMESFLLINGYRLRASVNDLVEVAIKIATSSESKFSFSDLVEWVRGRIVVDTMI